MDVACSRLDAGTMDSDWLETLQRISFVLGIYAALHTPFPTSKKQTAGYAAQMQGHPSMVRQRWRSCAPASLATWRSFVRIWKAKGRLSLHRTSLMPRPIPFGSQPPHETAAA